WKTQTSYRTRRMFAGSVALLLTLIALAVASKGAQADPTPFPWDKLSKELQEAARSASLPSRFIVATYINVTERLLMGESVFVPVEISPSDLLPLVRMSEVGYVEFDRTRCRTSCVSLDVSVKAIRTDVEWGYGFTGSGVKVGMLDTGVTSHPHLQLAASMGFGNDGSTNDCDPYGGHGTAVAGDIRSDDATYRGVAYSSSLYNAKVLNSDCGTT